jgi:hypothetical protein
MQQGDLAKPRNPQRELTEEEVGWWSEPERVRHFWCSPFVGHLTLGIAEVKEPFSSGSSGDRGWGPGRRCDPGLNSTPSSTILLPVGPEPQSQQRTNADEPSEREKGPKSTIQKVNRPRRDSSRTRAELPKV